MYYLKIKKDVKIIDINRRQKFFFTLRYKYFNFFESLAVVKNKWGEQQGSNEFFTTVKIVIITVNIIKVYIHTQKYIYSKYC